MKSKRLPKRRPNKNRAPKVVRIMRRIAAAQSLMLNPLRFTGVVKSSPALRSMCGDNNWW
jgi:hypothetical protein